MRLFVNADEFLRTTACEPIASEAKATVVSLAYFCKGFEDPVLDTL